MLIIGSSNGKKSGSSSVGTSIRSSQQRAFRLRTDPSERLNRPRPRDSHEPDSIPLLDLSSSEDNEAVRGRSTGRLRGQSVGEGNVEISLMNFCFVGLSALPPVIVPSKLPDMADLGECNISCCYDQKIEEYRELKNATQTVNFKVPVVPPGGIKFTRTVDFIWTTLFPGVQVTKTAETSGLSCGYMRISGYSVKPVEMVKDFTLVS